MAHMVVSAVVQESVSKVTSYLFGKHDDNDKSTKVAHTELELCPGEICKDAHHRCVPSTVLRRRKLLKRAFKDSGDLLHRYKKQQTVTEIDPITPVTHSFIRKRIAEMTQSFMSTCFSGFHKDNTSCSDVRRYEWFAGCANRFIKDVESGSLPLRCIFSSNPIVRQLLEGKTLEYKRVQGNILRRLHIWPMCVEGRGVEATLEFHYEDRKIPMKSFSLALMLRLSESTNIVRTAIRCLQSFTASMKHVAEAAIGELTQLPPQDISHSHSANSRFSIEELLFSYDTQFWRPDPLCCKPDGCATSCTQTELSCKFPEQVILIRVPCYVSAFDCSNLHNTADATAKRNLVGHWPPLKLGVGFVPHLFQECMQGRTSVEIIGGKAQHINDSLQQMDEMDMGAAYFIVQKSGTEIASAPKVDSGFETQRAAKRRRSKLED